MREFCESSVFIKNASKDFICMEIREEIALNFNPHKNNKFHKEFRCDLRPSPRRLDEIYF